MQLSQVLIEALNQVAWRRNADVGELRTAIEGESAVALARVLGIEKGMAEQHMARLQRALTIESDVGAGCKLLTDDVEAEVLAALVEL